MKHPMLLLLLIITVVILLLVGQFAPFSTGESEMTESEIESFLLSMSGRNIPYVDVNKPFPWSDRTSLVIYYGNDEDADPDRDYPSIVFDDYVSSDVLIADGAPYLTVVDHVDFLEEILRWKQQATSVRELNYATILQTWYTKQISDGEGGYFFYQLEPTEYAGDSYQWAKIASQKTKMNVGLDNK